MTTLEEVTKCLKGNIKVTKETIISLINSLEILIEDINNQGLTDDILKRYKKAVKFIPLQIRVIPEDFRPNNTDSTLHKRTMEFAKDKVTNSISVTVEYLKSLS